MKQFYHKSMFSRYTLTVKYIILTCFNDLITTFLSDLVSKTLKKLVSLWKKCSFLTRLTDSLMGNSFRITIPFFLVSPFRDLPKHDFAHSAKAECLATKSSYISPAERHFWWNRIHQVLAKCNFCKESWNIYSSR